MLPFPGICHVFILSNHQTEEQVRMPQTKTYKKDGTAARRSSAVARSSAHRQSMLYRPTIGPRVSRSEVKSLDLPGAAYTLNTTALVTPLNLIRAGTSFFNRIGRKVTLKSLHIKGQLRPVRTSAVVDYVRIMVVYDAQTNGALPAIADIIQDTDQAGTNTSNTYSAANLNNRDRFKILMDERIPLPTITITAGVMTNPGLLDPVQPSVDIQRYIKLKNLPTMFKVDSSPAVIGDIATGGLYLVTFGANAAASEAFEYAASTRLRYIDN